MQAAGPPRSRNFTEVVDKTRVGGSNSGEVARILGAPEREG
jgi:hypothetical protein